MSSDLQKRYAGITSGGLAASLAGCRRASLPGDRAAKPPCRDGDAERRLAACPHGQPAAGLGCSFENPSWISNSCALF